MNWSEIPNAAPVSMPGLLAFMERWKPGSTRDFKAASSAQIAALASFYGGGEALPPVYRQFLATMGESLGDLTLTWGTTSISALLEDLEDRDRERRAPSRYLKFSIGEDDYNGRHPDDYFDLTRRTPDGADAALLRIHERHLLHGEAKAKRPFPNFSDLLRDVLVAKTALALRSESPPFFTFGRHLDVLPRVYALLRNLGFEPTELGASTSTIPLEAPRREAVALLLDPSDLSICLRFRARDDAEERRLVEIVEDHRSAIMGG
ncbi:hypothetical protein [Nannocystis radixulma]|uniref:Knr4/Smi1-like domain-containing protein n=1 Tax=Nannocystis radixulma TaxID=2995305 RepID=A0ABT5BFR4_9BACT|nr:hypothetical protein [Nannocystis radixulma]MDC0672979.1 hypothetical protein [Nannocystis radixulma]